MHLILSDQPNGVGAFSRDAFHSPGLAIHDRPSDTVLLKVNCKFRIWGTLYDKFRKKSNPFRLKFNTHCITLAKCNFLLSNLYVDCKVAGRNNNCITGAQNFRLGLKKPCRGVPSPMSHTVIAWANWLSINLRKRLGISDCRRHTVDRLSSVISFLTYRVWVSCSAQCKPHWGLIDRRAHACAVKHNLCDTSSPVFSIIWVEESRFALDRETSSHVDSRETCADMLLVSVSCLIFHLVVDWFFQ